MIVVSQYIVRIDCSCGIPQSDWEIRDGLRRLTKTCARQRQAEDESKRNSRVSEPSNKFTMVVVPR